MKETLNTKLLGGLTLLISTVLSYTEKRLHWDQLQMPSYETYQDSTQELKATTNWKPDLVDTTSTYFIDDSVTYDLTQLYQGASVLNFTSAGLANIQPLMGPRGANSLYYPGANCFYQAHSTDHHEQITYVICATAAQSVYVYPSTYSFNPWTYIPGGYISLNKVIGINPGTQNLTVQCRDSFLNNQRTGFYFPCNITDNISNSSSLKMLWASTGNLGIGGAHSNPVNASKLDQNYTTYYIQDTKNQIDVIIAASLDLEAAAGSRFKGYAFVFNTSGSIPQPYAHYEITDADFKDFWYPDNFNHYLQPFTDHAQFYVLQAHDIPPTTGGQQNITYYYYKSCDYAITQTKIAFDCSKHTPVQFMNQTFLNRQIRSNFLAIDAQPVMSPSPGVAGATFVTVFGQQAVKSCFINATGFTDVLKATELTPANSSYPLSPVKTFFTRKNRLIFWYKEEQSQGNTILWLNLDTLTQVYESIQPDPTTRGGPFTSGAIEIIKRDDNVNKANYLSFGANAGYLFTSINRPEVEFKFSAANIQQLGPVTFTLIAHNNDVGQSLSQQAFSFQGISNDFAGNFEWKQPSQQMVTYSYKTEYAHVPIKSRTLVGNALKFTATDQLTKLAALLRVRQTGLADLTVDNQTKTYLANGFLDLVSGGRNYLLGVQLSGKGDNLYQILVIRVTRPPQLGSLQLNLTSVVDLSYYQIKKFLSLKVLNNKLVLIFSSISIPPQTLFKVFYMNGTEHSSSSSNIVFSQGEVTLGPSGLADIFLTGPAPLNSEEGRGFSTVIQSALYYASLKLDGSGVAQRPIEVDLGYRPALYLVPTDLKVNLDSTQTTYTIVVGSYNATEPAANLLASKLIYIFRTTSSTPTTASFIELIRFSDQDAELANPKFCLTSSSLHYYKSVTNPTTNLAVPHIYSQSLIAKPSKEVLVVPLDSFEASGPISMTCSEHSNTLHLLTANTSDTNSSILFNLRAEGASNSMGRILSRLPIANLSNLTVTPIFKNEENEVILPIFNNTPNSILGSFYARTQGPELSVKSTVNDFVEQTKVFLIQATPGGSSSSAIPQSNQLSVAYLNATAQAQVIIKNISSATEKVNLTQGFINLEENFEVTGVIRNISYDSGLYNNTINTVIPRLTNSDSPRWETLTQNITGVVGSYDSLVVYNDSQVWFSTWNGATPTQVGQAINGTLLAAQVWENDVLAITVDSENVVVLTLWVSTTKTNQEDEEAGTYKQVQLSAPEYSTLLTSSAKVVLTKATAEAGQPVNPNEYLIAVACNDQTSSITYLAVWLDQTTQTLQSTDYPQGGVTDLSNPIIDFEVTSFEGNHLVVTALTGNFNGTYFEVVQPFFNKTKAQASPLPKYKQGYDQAINSAIVNSSLAGAQTLDDYHAKIACSGSSAKSNTTNQVVNYLNCFYSSPQVYSYQVQVQVNLLNDTSTISSNSSTICTFVNPPGFIPHRIPGGFNPTNNFVSIILVPAVKPIIPKPPTPSASNTSSSTASSSSTSSSSNPPAPIPPQETPSLLQSGPESLGQETPIKYDSWIFVVYKIPAQNGTISNTQVYTFHSSSSFSLPTYANQITPILSDIQGQTGTSNLLLNTPYGVHNYQVAPLYLDVENIKTVSVSKDAIEAVSWLDNTKYSFALKPLFVAKYDPADTAFQIYIYFGLGLAVLLVLVFIICYLVKSARERKKNKDTFYKRASETQKYLISGQQDSTEMESDTIMFNKYASRRNEEEVAI